MLASTVQFSTNDQPKTRPGTPAPQTAAGMPPQVLPGTENNNLTARCRLSVVPSGPNRVLCLDALHQPHQAPFHTAEAAVLGHPGRCREKTGQCLRLGAPGQHTRLTWAPAFLSERSAP